MTAKKEPRVVGTSRGIPLTDDDIQRLADEAEAGYDLSQLRSRGGRPAWVRPRPRSYLCVWILSCERPWRTHKEIETSTSEVIREAIRRFLEVA